MKINYNDNRRITIFSNTVRGTYEMARIHKNRLYFNGV